MTDFQRIGQNVKNLMFAKAPDSDISAYLASEGIDAATLDASGYGPKSRKAGETTSKLKSFVQGFGQGGSMGYGDEIGAALAATVGRPTGQPIEGENWTDRYTTARDEIRDKLDVIRTDNPATYTAGNVAGAIAPALVAPELYGSKLIANAPSMLNMMGRSAGVGGVLGGITGFGNAEGSTPNQLLETGISAAAGGILGAAVPPLVAGATNLINRGTNAVRGVMGGNKTIAAEAPASIQATPATMPIQQSTSLGATPPVAQTTPLTPRAIPTPFEATAPRVTAKVTPNDKMTAISQLSRTLQDAGYTPDAVEKAVKALGPNATIADISEATQRLLRTQRSAPGPAVDIVRNALENRQSGQQGRLIQSVQKAFGTRGAIYETDDALVKKLADESAPLYRQAFDEGAAVDVSNVLKSVNDQLAKMPQKSPIRAALERARSMLGETDEAGKFTPYNDLETLHNAKLAIDDMLSSFGSESIGKVGKRAVMQLKNELMNAMDTASPVYRQARDLFSGTMTSRDALAAGRQFLKEDAESLASYLDDLAKEDAEMFRIGALRAITDTIKSKPSDVSVVQQLRKTGLLEKVRELLPDADAYGRFVQELDAERQFANTRAMALGGSQTAEKVLDAGDQARNLAQVATDVTSGTGLLARGGQILGQMFRPGESSRASIAQMLLEKDPVALQKILDDIAAFQRAQAVRNNAIGLGTVSGATTAGPAASGFASGRP